MYWKKTIKENKHEEILKEGKLADNNYDNDENNFKTKSSKQIKKGQLQKLKELHEQGILTDNEYYEKLAKIKTEKLQTELKLTNEYKKLKSLYDENILTKEEFESKVQSLKNNSSDTLGFIFHKVKNGYSKKLGRYEEFFLKNTNDKKYSHIYKLKSNNQYFIYKNQKIEYFIGKEAIIYFVINGKKKRI